MGARLTEAGVLAHTRDVFCLTVEELLSAVERADGAGSGVADIRSLAARRLVENKAQLSRPDPPERFTTRGGQIVRGPEVALGTGPDGEMRK
jgi:hypothetical protein